MRFRYAPDHDALGVSNIAVPCDPACFRLTAGREGRKGGQNVPWHCAIVHQRGVSEMFHPAVLLARGPAPGSLFGRAAETHCRADHLRIFRLSNGRVSLPPALRRVFCTRYAFDPSPRVHSLMFTNAYAPLHFV